ncbi:MAG TPA: helix-turn-helix domain-containing protein [Chitinophagales bacterium]|nr:helix-turn-helix domain-containing protein [Chitinophagales bacterium]
MYKSIPSGIRKYALDTTLHRLHKEGIEKNDFGMDNTSELIDGGFGLYSTANTKRNIGPVKTEYYRIGLIRSGSATYTIGLETFHPVRNTIVFGFPGQLFSLQNPTDDFFALYMLFSESFIAESLLLKNYRNQFPFLSYAGVQCFPLSEEEGNEIETIIMKMNGEVKGKKANVSQAIQLYIQLIFITASRSYAHKMLSKQGSGDQEVSLFTRFLKLVSEHFLSVQKVSDYATMLHVSADHLNRTIKSHSDKTAHELIDEMILREAKAYLLHSELSIAEIAYHLGFSDPSHFNKFFRKLADCTPLRFRNKSE